LVQRVSRAIHYERLLRRGHDRHETAPIGWCSDRVRLKVLSLKARSLMYKL
jgi:hypothetical protein